LKKQYETPNIEIEEFEIENILGNLCSGIDFLLKDVPIDEYTSTIW
jgi:hypothetical protein